MPARTRAKNDCLRCSIAVVLGLPKSRVPHFVKRYKGRWAWHLTEWCGRRGKRLVYAGITTERGRNGIVAGVKRWIVIGTTRRGTCHAVVVQRDIGVTHDWGFPLRSSRSLIVIV